MAVTKQNIFEGGSNNTNLSTANSGGISGDAFSGSSIYPGVIFSTAAAMFGTLGMRASAASGTAAFADHSGFSSTSLSVRFCYIPHAVVGSTIVYQARTSVGQVGNCSQTTSGQLQFQNSAGTALTGGTTSGLVLGNKYQILVQIFSDATAGTFAWQVYTLAGTLVSSNTHTAQNTRGGNITNSRFGKVLNSAETGFFDFDAVITSDGTTTPQALASSNLVPVANAGADQVVAPFSTVTLSSALSTDPDGTIASQRWDLISNTSSTTPVLSSATSATPTYTAPGDWHVGSSQTWQLTVTDNLGATNTDTVVVAVNPAARGLIRAGGVVTAMKKFIV